MDKLIFTVHQVNEYVKGILDRDPILQQVWVRGEISNFKLHSSGHMYFTLKDEVGKIKCVLFKYYSDGINFVPEDGMRVVIRGHVSMYCKDGQYQLYAEYMEKDGLGQLYMAFEDLKKRLKEEGLFDPAYKKPIPLFPKKIGVITSNTGAAVRDIIKVVKRRNPCVDILVIPVLVQGQFAKDQISAALDYINTRKDIDVIIVGRGGGSIEELWAFNEEKVARAIWRSHIPVISAVGHETDFTISDFVADLRAPTPSAAGELVVQDTAFIKHTLMGLQRQLFEIASSMIRKRQEKVERIASSYVFKYPERLMQKYQQQLDNSINRLEITTNYIIDNKKEALYRLMASLDALSPLAVLSRGYALVSREDTGCIISSTRQISKNEKILLQFKDGSAKCLVSEVQKES